MYQLLLEVSRNIKTTHIQIWPLPFTTYPLIKQSSHSLEFFVVCSTLVLLEMSNSFPLNCSERGTKHCLQCFKSFSICCHFFCAYDCLHGSWQQQHLQNVVAFAINYSVCTDVISKKNVQFLTLSCHRDLMSVIQSLAS